MSGATTTMTPVQRALSRQRDAGKPLEEGQGEAIAHDILERAAAAEQSVEEYLISYARSLDVKAPDPNMQSAFWSHGIPHPDLPSDQVLSNQYLAAEWSERENDRREGSARYLEGTAGGQELDELHLWDNDVFTGLGLNRTQGQDLARKVWAALSEEYAKETRGEAVAFAETLAPWTVAYETEMPQLRKSPGPEHIHFVYDLPEDLMKGLPPETRTLLSQGDIRSHLHFFAPDADNPPSQKYWEAGYLDLDQVRSLPTSEAQRAAILEVCANVARLDERTADAEKYSEESLRLRAEQEQEQATVGVEEQQPAPAQQPHRAQESPGHSPVAAVPVKAVAAGAHGVDFMPGVAVNAQQVIPGAHGGPQRQEPARTLPAPTRVHGTDLGM